MIFRIDEVITREEVSIMFDDGDITARLPEDTEGMLLAEGGSRSLLEDLDFDTPDILSHPFLKDRAQEVAQSLSRHTAVADAAVLPRFRFD